MGTGIEMKCNRCHYHPAFSVGIGMNFRPGNIFAEDLDSTMLSELLENEKEYERFKLAAKNGAVLQPNYGYKIYQCTGCDNIDNYFFLEVKLSDTFIAPEYQCYVCRKPLIEVQLNTGSHRKIGCPICEEGLLQPAGTYLWD